MPTALSRRTLFKAGSGVLATTVLVSASGADAGVTTVSRNETIERRWLGLWTENHRDWAPFDAILADDFTFTSPNNDDHISKARFKARCWAPNIGLSKGMDIELMMAKGDQIFVKYLAHTTGGKSFRNVELHQFRDGRIASIECYFGGAMSFPSGVEAQKS